MHGRDITDEPVSLGKPQESLTEVEIVLTTTPARISGRVSDARGEPTTDFTVIGFATDPYRWYQRSRFLNVAQPKDDGTFELAGLPPGEYFVAAVDWMQGNESAGEWQDPVFLQGIEPRATRVTVAEGQLVSLALPLIVR